MLSFILGDHSSDLLGTVFSRIELDSKPTIIITPEQFSFELEKTLYNKLPKPRLQNIQVLSFTRLAYLTFKQCGGVSVKSPDDISKLMAMRQAVLTVLSDLLVYKNKAVTISFVKLMLDEIDNLKNSGVTANDLANANRSLKAGLLKDKTHDIALIYQAYEMVLSTTYEDTSDILTRSAVALSGLSLFTDYNLYLYGFDGFTHPEYTMLSQLMANTNMTVCLSYLPQYEEVSFFEGTKKTYHRLIALANRGNVKVKAPIKCYTAKDISAELLHIGDNLFSQCITRYEGENRSVIIAACRNEYDEINLAIAKIYELVRDYGYRFRDIIITSRDLEFYAPKLKPALEKQCVPFSMDQNDRLQDKLLIRFIFTVFEIVTNSFSVDAVLMLLKTGLLPYSNEQIGEFENYCYIWDIKGSSLRSPFTKNPMGLTAFDKRSIEQLKRIEAVRSSVITPLEEFLTATKSKGAKEISALLYNLLVSFNIQSQCADTAKGYFEVGDIYNANLTIRVWNLALDAINKLAVGGGDTSLSIKDYSQLFDLVISSYDFGVIEQTLDCVLISQLQRMRANSPKVVIILGANEGVFPKVQGSKGLFTDGERTLLQSLELDLSSSDLGDILNERFLAYKAVTTPTDRLMITYKKVDLLGKVQRPSVVCQQITTMFEDNVMVDTDDLSAIEYCSSYRAAFEQLTMIYNQDSSTTAALRAVLGENAIYRDKLYHIEQAKRTRSTTLKNKELAKQLYGDRITISPSRVESYYRCAFMYFCRYGLGVKPLTKATYSPLLRGDLVHNIVDIAYNDVKQLPSFDKEYAKEVIDRRFDEYLQNVLSESSSGTTSGSGYQSRVATTTQNRIIHTLGRFKRVILDIIESIYHEQAQSRFKIIDTEYDISSKSDIRPLTIKLEDDSTMEIVGRIDRIDMYEDVQSNNERYVNERYVRVVDYKTGNKRFNLSDILHGMNMQMLIYLFAICKNGQNRYKDCKPAGVLYFPARAVAVDKGDNPDYDYSTARTKTHTMNGILLADRTNNDSEVDLSILKAMEEELASNYIPIKLKKDASISERVKVDGVFKASLDSLQTPTQFEQIYRYLVKKVKAMGDSICQGDIHEGRIADVCNYCEFQGICTTDRRESLSKLPALPVDEIYKD